MRWPKLQRDFFDEGKGVVMVAHSYRGVPTTQSLEYTSIKARTAAGKTGSVSRVVI